MKGFTTVESPGYARPIYSIMYDRVKILDTPDKTQATNWISHSKPESDRNMVERHYFTASQFTKNIYCLDSNPWFYQDLVQECIKKNLAKNFLSA